MERLVYAIKAFFAALGGAKLVPAESQAVEAPASAPVQTPAAPASAKGSEFEEGAVYALSLLQREGRLVDFLQEDLASFSDAQIGGAARQIHSSCAKILKERFGVEPIVKGVQEGTAFTLPASFDPCEFKLTGNAPENGAGGKGSLVHKGWRAAKLDLPKRTGRVRADVVCQAELEFQ